MSVQRINDYCRDCVFCTQQKVKRSPNTCSSVSRRPLLPSIFCILQHRLRLPILNLSKHARFRDQRSLALDDRSKPIPQGFPVFDNTISWCGPPRLKLGDAYILGRRSSLMGCYRLSMTDCILLTAPSRFGPPFVRLSQVSSPAEL